MMKQSISSGVRTAWRIAGLLAAGGALGYLLLILVYCIPEGPIQEHLSDAPQVLEKEGDQLIRGFPTTFLTNFTDAIMLSMAGYDDPEPAYRAALLSRFPAVEGSWRPIETLADYLQGGQGLIAFEYDRYWHGYLVVLKPLLYFFHYGQIRMLGMFAQYALFIRLAALLLRRNKGGYIVPLASAAICLTPFVLALSFANAVCFYIILISSIMQLTIHERLSKGRGYFLFFTAAGMAAGYFDFLTWPVATLGFPLVLYLILEEGEKEKKKLRELFLFAVCWGIGYAGMWAEKWLLASLILEHNVFADAFSTIRARSGGAGGIGLSGRIDAALLNLKVFGNPPYLMFFLCNLGYQAAGMLRRRVSPKGLFKRSAGFAAAAVLPLLWYIAAAEHSQIHYTFTYRALSVTVFAGLSLLASGGDGREKRPKEIRRNGKGKRTYG